jgi:hypothetical protein
MNLPWTFEVVDDCRNCFLELMEILRLWWWRECCNGELLMAARRVSSNDHPTTSWPSPMLKVESRRDVRDRVDIKVGHGVAVWRL